MPAVTLDVPHMRARYPGAMPQNATISQLMFRLNTPEKLWSVVGQRVRRENLLLLQRRRLLVFQLLYEHAGLFDAACRKVGLPQKSLQPWLEVLQLAAVNPLGPEVTYEVMRLFDASFPANDPHRTRYLVPDLITAVQANHRVTQSLVVRGIILAIVHLVDDPSEQPHLLNAWWQLYAGWAGKLSPPLGQEGFTLFQATLLLCEVMEFFAWQGKKMPETDLKARNNRLLLLTRQVFEAGDGRELCLSSPNPKNLPAWYPPSCHP
ncbi:MAG: hypothetical protein GC129_05975 [Proteobacteria bacterium]|nr:hypothetical protein [Pseudomonadota bacterium]